jgi:hypothetical protein
MLQEDNEPTSGMESPGAPGEGESSNRTFLIAAGALAVVVLLLVICMAIYGLVYLPGRNEARQATDQAVGTLNAQMFAAMTSTAEAAQWTATVQASPTVLPTATSTPVVAMPADTATPDTLPLTATMAVLRTQVAIAQLTPTGTLAMPRSGIADEIGLPGLLIGVITLVAVIFLVRRLRAAPVR